LSPAHANSSDEEGEEEDRSGTHAVVKEKCAGKKAHNGGKREIKFCHRKKKKGGKKESVP